MSRKVAHWGFATVVVAAMTASALPPAGTTVGDYSDFIQAFMTTCTANAKAPAACSYETYKNLVRWFGPAPGIVSAGLNTQPTLAPCLENDAAAWVWFASCVKQGFNKSALVPLADFVNVPGTAGLLDAARQTSDPCGAIKDQLLAQVRSQCPLLYRAPLPKPVLRR